ncbi:hypothetical protein LTR78_005528 [Recurvomyces mirabilis]|uniref:HD/PDEase domain-containing protein n=1 Tax=Recurvomyces mirabilis TaxID=574656 RepID=A0AAE1C1G2_9PEZI|nr:hypothetical protein LTR78_005528 [Recurvomyces mirabilis]KAK5158481.1 hypothetical protein LTS14_003500 [Recurvomyces mirabilis]
MCPPASGSSGLAENTSSAPIDPAIYPDYIPTDSGSKANYTYAATQLHPEILRHSLRVYLLAHAIASREGCAYATDPRKLSLLFAACIFHDMGTCASHNGPQRFEVEGGDAAATALRSQGYAEDEAHDVWVAIALHTSPGIAERISSLARLVRLGVAIDFKRPAAMPLSNEDEVLRFEGKLPRGEIEKVLGDAVANLALEKFGHDEAALATKAPGSSWPGGLVKSRRENPEWQGVNKAF